MFYKVFGVFMGEQFSHTYENEFDARLAFYDASWRLNEGDFLQCLIYRKKNDATTFVEYKEMNPLNMSNEEAWTAGIIRMETFLEAELDAWLKGKEFKDLPIESFSGPEIVDYYDAF